MVNSGVASLDALLEGGLTLGDNIVWLSDGADALDALGAAFLRGGEGASPGQHRHLCCARSATCVRHRGIDVDHVGDAPELLPSDLEALMLGSDITSGTRMVIERVDDLVVRWGVAETVRFYRRTCPRLFERGATAYWMATPDAGSAVVEGISRIAQCVFDIRAGRMRVVKAEGRPRRLQGVTTTFELVDGAPVVSREHVVGRLGEGLRRTRRERNLTQTQMAVLAGVTPAAISQAETGRRGFSLDTIVSLCDALQIGVDDLLGTGRPPDPLLVRHDRTDTSLGTVPMFDDPTFGPRTFLMHIGVGEDSPPPFTHKGPELILMAEGLVLVDLGDATPVLRAGDGLRVTDSHVRRLTNLADRESRLFWVAVSASPAP